MQVWWRTHLSFWHYINGRYEQSAAVIAEAREIAERYGLEAYLFEIDHAEASALISKGDLRGREGAPRRDGAAPLAGAPHGLGLFPSPARDPRAAPRALRRRGADAERARRARARDRPPVAADAAFPRPPRALPHARPAIARAACSALDEAIARRAGVDREHVRAAARAVADRRRHGRRRDDARAAASRRVLADYRAAQHIVFLRNRPDLAARLANFALEHGIETEFVRMLIERNALAAPADAATGVAVPVARFARSADSSSSATASRCASPARRSNARSIC